MLFQNVILVCLSFSPSFRKILYIVGMVPFQLWYINNQWQANNNLSVRRDWKKKQEIISIGFHTNKFENQKKQIIS